MERKPITNALTLRKDEDFDSLEQYEQFLEKIVSRASEVDQERKALRVPQRIVRVLSTASSAGDQGNHCSKNRYSVPSTLIGQVVELRVYPKTLEIWRANTLQ